MIEGVVNAACEPVVVLADMMKYRNAIAHGFDVNGFSDEKMTLWRATNEERRLYEEFSHLSRE